MSKALETGKSLLDAVLAKLPESLRDSAKTAFAAPEAADALTELGARGLAQSDYSRQMDEIRRKEQELATAQSQINEVATQQTDWWNVNKPALEEYTRLKASGSVTPPAVTPPASTGISKEDLEKYLAHTIPLLETFQPGNDSERAALKDALDKAKEAQNSAKEALSIVPKTEKKRNQ